MGAPAPALPPFSSDQHAAFYGLAFALSALAYLVTREGAVPDATAARSPAPAVAVVYRGAPALREPPLISVAATNWCRPH